MPSETPQCARCGIKLPERLCQNDQGRAPEGCPTRHSEETIQKAMEEMHRPGVVEFARNAAIQEGEGYAGRGEGYGRVRPAKTQH